MATLKKERFKIVVKDGEVHFLYNEELRQGLREALGAEEQIQRASHVNPSLERTPTGEVQFEADLAPAGGPKLLGFPSYDAAVKGEIAWLETHVITTSKPSSNPTNGAVNLP